VSEFGTPTILHEVRVSRGIGGDFKKKGSARNLVGILSVALIEVSTLGPRYAPTILRADVIGRVYVPGKQIAAHALTLKFVAKIINSLTITRVLLAR
jgi:hypothetical protein